MAFLNWGSRWDPARELQEIQLGADALDHGARKRSGNAASTD